MVTNPNSPEAALPLAMEKPSTLCHKFLTEARRLLEAAHVVNEQLGHGHVAAGLLYDCFENLAQAGISHAGRPLPDYRQKGVHGKRKSQFIELYRHHLPDRALQRVRVVIERRNAIRYVDPESGLAPHEIEDFHQHKVRTYVAVMKELLDAMDLLLRKPYPGRR